MNLEPQMTLTAVIQMEVRDNDAIDVRGDRSFGHDIRKVREPPLVVVAHVHSTIEHNVLAAKAKQDAASADVLSRAQRCYLNFRHVLFATASCLLLLVYHLLKVNNDAVW